MWRRRRSQEDFAAEIRSHLELERDARDAEGRSADSAARSFGNVARLQEQFYEKHRWLWWDHLRQDLRFAGRTLTRSPGFAAVAIVTLALGIGANTAIFSAIDEALFRPFPLPNPNQLVQVYSVSRQTNRFVSTSFPDYEDFRRRSQSFQQLSAYLRLPLNIGIGGHTERITVEAVTDNYFAMLEVPALMGRTIGAEDDRVGAAPAAMIGETLWRERFQSDPAILGKALTIEDHSFRIVGVVPRRYTGINLNWDDTPSIWIAIHAAPLVVPGFTAADVFHRRVQFVPVTGRLRPGVSPARAEAELKTIAARLAQSEPATNRDLTAVVFELSRSKFWPSYRDTVRLTLGILAAAAGLVLLLGCANLSNLLLQRALGRRREFAIRLAIGAGRARLIRQLLTESLLLVIPGFALALLIARGVDTILLRFPGAFGLPLALGLPLETRVLAFSAFLSLGAAFLFGLAPALRGARADVWPALKDAGGASLPSRDATRQSLVVVQVAFCFVLLVGGGLFARALSQAYAADVGFRPWNLLLIEYNFPQSLTTSPSRMQTFRELLPREIASIPGVASAALGTPLLSSFRRLTGVENRVVVEFENVGPGFFRTAGVPLQRGREFNSGDQPEGTRVAIVNQMLARLLSADGAVIGRTIRLTQGPPAHIVGIAADAKYHSVWDQPQPHLYLDLDQANSAGSTLMVRTGASPESVMPLIRRQWEQFAPAVPLIEIRTGAEQVDRSLAPQRAAAVLFDGFAVLAILLASIGLYGAIAHSVAQRTREIGVRIAIGASPQSVVRRVLGRAMAWAATGIAAGAILSWFLTRLIAPQLRTISPHDPVTFFGVALFVAGVSAASAWLPARRAARIDPVRTLRWE